MTTLREAAQQALEALEEIADEVFSPYDNKLGDAILALRAALAQQEEPVWMHPWPPVRAQQAEPDHETRAEIAEQRVVQLAEERDHYRNLWQKAQQAEPVEPVAWLYEAGADRTLHWHKPPLYGTPLYTAPPQRQPQTIDEAMQQPRSMAQAYEAGYKAGVAHEREACAQVCEARFVGDLTREDMEARRCAAAIRARSNT